MPSACVKQKKFDVFWTFVANFGEKVRTVEACDAKEAITKGTYFDPNAQSETGSKMKFIVWEHGKGLVVNHKTIDEV
jgi:hypothetical protein